MLDTVTAHSWPFRYWTFASFDPLDIIGGLPGDNAPDWVRYSSPWESHKRTCNRLDRLPWSVVQHVISVPFVERLRELTGIDDLIPDPFFHGAGLHVIDEGGQLGCHVDYAQHPKADYLERRLSLVMFASCWGGGDLCLWNDTATQIEARIEPTPGTAVAFENSDIAYHSVDTVVGKTPRVTVAMYYVAPRRPWARRKRALWVPQRAAGNN